MSDSPYQQLVHGTVVKISSLNTIRVATKVTKVHPLYKKRYSRTRFFVVHDPKNSAKVGDEVTIVPCRPVSKNKRWTLQ